MLKLRCREAHLHAMESSSRPRNSSVVVGPSILDGWNWRPSCARPREGTLDGFRSVVGGRASKKSMALNDPVEALCEELEDAGSRMAPKREDGVAMEFPLPREAEERPAFGSNGDGAES